MPYNNNIEWPVKVAILISLLIILIGTWYTHTTSIISQSKIDQRLQLKQYSQQIDNEYKILSSA